MDIFSLAGFVGLVCTKSVDTIKHIAPRRIPDWGSIILSIVFGIAYAWLLNFNVFEGFDYANVAGPKAIVLTGFVVGTLGSGFYEVLDVVSTKASQLKKIHGVRRRGSESNE